MLAECSLKTSHVSFYFGHVTTIWPKFPHLQNPCATLVQVFPNPVSASKPLTKVLLCCATCHPMVPSSTSVASWLLSQLWAFGWWTTDWGQLKVELRSSLACTSHLRLSESWLKCNWSPHHFNIYLILHSWSLHFVDWCSEFVLRVFLSVVTSK